MTTRTIHLVSYRQSAAQRAHFAIFVPSSTDLNVGTIVQVLGAPMAGFALNFKRNYNLQETRRHYSVYPIGEVVSSHIVDSTDATISADQTPRGDLEIAASRVRPPGVSRNFNEPVNDTTNKRCQEWTMEYVQALVALGYISGNAAAIVQSKRDPPSHGIGLRPVDLGKAAGSR